MSDINSSLPVRTETRGDVAVKVVDNTVVSQGLTVNADGSVNITDNGGSLTVDATDLDIRDLDSAQDSVEVLQATHDNLNLNANIQVGNADVANGNPVPVSDAGGSLTVDATNLDIRDLVFATDKVDVTNSVVALDAGTLAALESITVQNPGGAGAVNIQDGGNSITVDAVDLDIRNLSASQDNVAISDGTDTLAVNADGSINSVVTATNLDIRDLTHVSDSVRVGDGTDFLAVNADGSINVVPLEDPGTETVNYNTAAAVAGGGTSNHDLLFTTGGRLYQVFASGSERMKAEVQVETGSATNVFNTVIVGFNSTATPNIDLTLSKYATIPTGARVRVIRTNRGNQAQDLYSTIVGIAN